MDSKMRKNESLDQFILLASQDQELQEKLKAAKDPEAMIRSAVEQGKEKGYSFTSDEMAERLYDVTRSNDSEFRSLEEEELEAVAGGRRLFTKQASCKGHPKSKRIKFI